MALTQQQVNFVTDLQAQAAALIPISDSIEKLVARWNLNSLGNKMQDEDIQTQFPGLTLAKIVNVVTTIEALQTTFGDYVSGNRVNLIEMQT